MATIPPPPPPPEQQRSRVAVYVVAAVLGIVIASTIGALVIFNTFWGGPSCAVANPAAVRAIESGAEKGFEGSTLSDAYTYGPVSETYPNGNTVQGYLLAARTPAGVAVWALDDGAPRGESAYIAAINAPAVTVANWGSSLPTRVDGSDVAAAQVCLPPE